MTSHKVQHRIERIIVEPTDCEKERLLCSLCNEIMTKPAKYLGKAVFNRLNHNPENLFNFVKLHRNWAPTTHANEATDDKLLLEALTVYAQHNIADRRLHHQPSSALDYNTALDRLGEFLPSWVIRGIEQEPQFLSALLITDLIRHRVRYLNKTYRMMQDLRSLLTTASLPKKASAIRELASDIINSECRSGDLVEKRGGTGHIPRAEFYSHIATIMRKASYIGKARDQEFDAARYEGINVRTTNRLYKLMEGLRSNRQCLSWDFSWGESHYTIPELLFSGTSDSLLLEGPGKRIEASLTVRLMPAIVEGRLEPVLFRQKMRVQGDDDLYRIALNDMAIALAARCGASRIIMASGFIGDPEAHGYQPELYIKDHGILISYKDSQGRKLTERVVLSNRRRISGVELIFVEPEISTADGFHAHDDKQTYRRDSEEILGIQCRTFHDPRDRFSERKQFLPAFWVVDVERRILAIE